MRINLLQLLMALFLLENSLFGLADDKQSYIGEYAEKNNGKYTKVDFPRCRQIDSGLLVSQSGEWYFLSECDIEQSKFKSIRIWRAKLDNMIIVYFHAKERMMMNWMLRKWILGGS
jgi:hypothetical protein